MLAPKGARPGDFIHQPGPRDLEILTGYTRVAKLGEIAAARQNEVNETDCALAILDPSVETIGNVPPAGFPESGRMVFGIALPTQLAIGEGAAFVGRTSGHSRGRIKASRADDLELHDDGANYTFCGCIEIEGLDGPFCQPGDGGALVYRERDAQAVGMVFAGPGPTDAPKIGYVLPIQPALTAMGVELL